ncbi:hypothetical protein K474DRAFT_1669554 [Panus rudis PR-1116 ss-1]|nr:hypothetical protein K474DRAFT_1669719 [Panus rudis PR-1116 ss-1]KAI0070939.1 hypothetical protein K474DRAFT_1669554 [Panus rudis PR-1116 ss-1]
MVSSVSPASTKPPPISYADRAKQKAQAPLQSAQRAHSQNASVASTATTGSSVSSNAQTVSTNASSIDPSSPLASSHPPIAAPSNPNAPQKITEDKSPVPTSQDAHPDPIPGTSSRAQKNTLVANVWSVRMEQMAQTRAVPTPPHIASSSTSPNTSNDKRAEVVSQVPEANASHTPSPQPSVSSSTLNGGNLRGDSHDKTLNGHSTANSLTTPSKAPSSLSTPPAADLEDWPTIGSSQPMRRSPSNGNAGAMPAKEKDESERKESSSGPKKNEKTKWIPIPPEEMQAAIDAHQRNRASKQGQPHSRSRPQYQNQSSAGPNNTSNPASVSNSQRQSRTQSVAGNRQSGSPSGSLSQSQAQSRTGSVHSSPRQASSRGGRRLPEDRLSSTGNRSMRSSRTTSPQRLGRGHTAPSMNATMGVEARALPDLDITQLQESNLPRDPSYPEPRFPYAYPPIPGSNAPARPHPYQPPVVSNSPPSQPYGLPPPPGPGVYPGSPPYFHSAGYGPPPYPMYPPYMYPYPPYMPPWSPGQQDPSIPYVPIPPSQEQSPGPRPQSGVEMAPPDPVYGIPPPSSLTRPPPPEQSDAVAGYRDVAVVLPSSSSAEHESQEAMGADHPRQLSFGSIGAPGIKSPPPVSPPGESALGLDVRASIIHSTQSEEELGIEKPFTSFTIGLAPGEPAPPHIRTQTSEDSTASQEATNVSQPKWEFGSTQQELPDEVPQPPPALNGGDVIPPPSAHQTNTLNTEPLQSEQQQPPVQPRPELTPLSTIDPLISPSTLRSPVTGPVSYPPSAVSQISSPGRSGDEWQVRNYGWGFGRGNIGAGLASGLQPEDRRDFQRPRRGSPGGFGFDRGGHDRGGFSGRRGRGNYGRGSRHPSRGSGYQHPQHVPQKPPFAVVAPPPMSPIADYYPPPVPPPSGTTYYHPAAYDPYAFVPYQPTPPPPVPAVSPSTTTGPPLPNPISKLSFPLDPLRYQLLGQLEYYLSAQNLVKDFFLRQNMDSRGWIFIPLIASFNRVKHLTLDLQLVKDVLALSTLVEVRDNHVRIHEWQRFVLPDASQSTVEPSPKLSAEPNVDSGATQSVPPTEEVSERSPNHVGDDGDEEEQEEEEEDIEIVLGTDASAHSSWTPDRNAA